MRFASDGDDVIVAGAGYQWGVLIRIDSQGVMTPSKRISWADQFDVAVEDDGTVLLAAVVETGVPILRRYAPDGQLMDGQVCGALRDSDGIYRATWLGEMVKDPLRSLVAAGWQMQASPEFTGPLWGWVARFPSTGSDRCRPTPVGDGLLYAGTDGPNLYKEFNTAALWGFTVTNVWVRDDPAYIDFWNGPQEYIVPYTASIVDESVMNLCENGDPVNVVTYAMDEHWGDCERAGCVRKPDGSVITAIHVTGTCDGIPIGNQGFHGCLGLGWELQDSGPGGLLMSGSCALVETGIRNLLGL